MWLPYWLMKRKNHVMEANEWMPWDWTVTSQRSHSWVGNRCSSSPEISRNSENWIFTTAFIGTHKCTLFKARLNKYTLFIVFLQYLFQYYSPIYSLVSKWLFSFSNIEFHTWSTFLISLSPSRHVSIRKCVDLHDPRSTFELQLSFMQFKLATWRDLRSYVTNSL